MYVSPNKHVFKKVINNGNTYVNILLETKIDYWRIKNT